MLETIKQQIYLGSFKLNEDKIEFDNALTRSEMLDLGDVVYFMVHGNDVLRLVKPVVVEVSTHAWVNTNEV